MNKTASTIISWILSIAFGIMLAMRWAFFYESIELHVVELNYYLGYILFLLFVFLVLCLQPLVQTIGTVIGGLLTGYRIGYLQIRNLELLRANGRTTFRFKPGRQRYISWNLFPPERKNGRCPVLLYLLGGPLFGLILSIILMILSTSLYDYPVVSMFLYIFSATGLLHALLTGIPRTYRDGGHNIGFTALELAQDDVSRQADWLNKKIFETIAHGIPLQDMPAEWFPSPSREEMGNPHVANLSLFVFDRLLAKGQYDAAAQLARDLAHFGNLSPLMHDVLSERRLYLELVTQNRPEVVSEMLTQKLRNSMEQKAFRSVNTLTTRYAYMMLYKHDAATAKTVIEDFEKEVRGDLFPADVQGDRNLLLLVDRVAAQRGITL